MRVGDFDEVDCFKNNCRIVLGFTRTKAELDSAKQDFNDLQTNYEKLQRIVEDKDNKTEADEIAINNIRLRGKISALEVERQLLKNKTTLLGDELDNVMQKLKEQQSFNIKTRSEFEQEIKKFEVIEGEARRKAEKEEARLRNVQAKLKVSEDKIHQNELDNEKLKTVWNDTLTDYRRKRLEMVRFEVAIKKLKSELNVLKKEIKKFEIKPKVTTKMVLKNLLPPFLRKKEKLQMSDAKIEGLLAQAKKMREDLIK